MKRKEAEETQEMPKRKISPIRKRKLMDPADQASRLVEALPPEEIKIIPNPDLIIDHTKNMKQTLKYSLLKSFKSARAGELTLGHGKVKTPVYMPVGTKGAMKALTTADMESLGCEIHLANTYHLDLRPGPKKLGEYGGIHKFMGWNRNLLTDSGGFQMVSLNDLMNISEKGVTFKSILDGSIIQLAPEDSIHVQNKIGADIMMVLDDVVHVLTKGPRVEDACKRSVRWLDRCIAAHERSNTQAMFAIVHGGLDEGLRDYSLDECIKRDLPGYAIGGLSGGESKDEFWQIVAQCTAKLPKDKPRYLMGVGYPEDIVICAILGCDMFDCVFGTRTARFGCALTKYGPLKLKKAENRVIFDPIEEGCTCYVCQNYSRSLIHELLGGNPVAVHLISYHNVHYLLNLMWSLRKAIMEEKVPEFANKFINDYYRDKEAIPLWIKHALEHVGIELVTDKRFEEKQANVKIP